MTVLEGVFASRRTTNPTFIALEGEDDYPADPSTTGIFAPDGTASGVFEVGDDVDWFAITVNAGQTLDIVATYDRDATTRAWPAIQFFDAAGQPIAGPQPVFYSPYQTVSTSLTPTVSGVYYVAASAWGAAGASYTLTASLRADDYAGEIGGATTGMFEAAGPFEQGDVYDVDWFAVELSAGETLEIASTTGLSLGDNVMLHGPTGDSVWWGGQWNGAISLTAGMDGTYFVSVRGYSETDLSYSFDTRIFRDDYADSTGPGGPEPFGVLDPAGGALSGALDNPADRDFFRIDLQADEGVNIRLTPDGAGLNSLYLFVYNEAGNQVFGYQVSGAFAESLFAPVEGGTYYVQAYSASGAVGDYQLNVSPIADDYSFISGNSGAIAIDGPYVEGAIQFANDVDRFVFSDEAGQIVLLDAYYPRQGGDLFSLPSLHAPSGETVAPGSSASISMQAMSQT